MKVSIRFFASLKEALKKDHIDLEIPDSIKTIGDLKEYLAKQDAISTEVFGAHKNIRAAQDLEMVTMDTVIRDGAEIAFFPPVTGG